MTPLDKLNEPFGAAAADYQETISRGVVLQGRISVYAAIDWLVERNITFTAGSHKNPDWFLLTYNLPRDQVEAERDLMIHCMAAYDAWQAIGRL